MDKNRLPMQETWVQSLIWKDPTCRAANKSVRCNCSSCALEPGSHNYWARMSPRLKPTLPRAHALREATTTREYSPLTTTREEQAQL